MTDPRLRPRTHSLCSWFAPVQAELGYEGQHEEFGLTLCETMATLGASHLGAITNPGSCRPGGWRGPSFLPASGRTGLGQALS